MFLKNSIIRLHLKITHHFTVGFGYALSCTVNSTSVSPSIALVSFKGTSKIGGHFTNNFPSLVLVPDSLLISHVYLPESCLVILLISNVCTSPSVFVLKWVLSGIINSSLKYLNFQFNNYFQKIIIV